ncbi:MAG: hypothetical protein AAB415_02195 [Patescibacteria group bacterium]
MHLPQTQIDNGLKLGILGVRRVLSPIDGVLVVTATHVQLLLTSTDDYGPVTGSTYTDIVRVFGDAVTMWEPVGEPSSGGKVANYIFSVTVAGELRDPMRFVGSLARKFRGQIKKLGDQIDQAMAEIRAEDSRKVS